MWTPERIKPCLDRRFKGCLWEGGTEKDKRILIEAEILGKNAGVKMTVAELQVRIDDAIASCSVSS